MPDNIQSWLSFTVTAYNVDHMIDFMKWKLRDSGFVNINRTKRRPIITHHVAHHPPHLNIRVLPDEEKARITQRFTDFVQWVEDEKYPAHTIKQAHNIANGVCKYMNSESYYENEWDYFCSYTRSLDRIRNESLVDVAPHLVKYMI
jgi:hypothetical protein